jgi:general secretion pathway protein A
MYREFYGFQDDPFNLTPDPRFLYLTAQHREALNHLLYGIRQRKGFICLTGEVGTGKTTLCRALLRELGHGYHTALILNPMLSRTQLMRAICAEFGVVVPGDRDRLACMTALNEFLLRASSAGRDAVLVIDEAQDVSTGCLELVRLLGNLETETQKLLQIVLMGQPELRAKLGQPALRQLAQRITVRFHLEPMDLDDTVGYLRHRLEVAAGRTGRVSLEAGAVREIFRYSGGTPRLVNAIGDKALLAGYVHQTRRINRRLARLAAAELRGATP